MQKFRMSQIWGSDQQINPFHDGSTMPGTSKTAHFFPGKNYEKKKTLLWFSSVTGANWRGARVGSAGVGRGAAADSVSGSCYSPTKVVLSLTLAFTHSFTHSLFHSLTLLLISMHDANKVPPDSPVPRCSSGCAQSQNILLSHANLLLNHPWISHCISIRQVITDCISTLPRTVHSHGVLIYKDGFRHQ